MKLYQQCKSCKEEVRPPRAPLGCGLGGLSRVTCREQEEAAGEDADVHAVPLPPAAALHHLPHQLRELGHQGFLMLPWLLPSSLRGPPRGHVPVTQRWPRLAALRHRLRPAAIEHWHAPGWGIPGPPKSGGTADLAIDPLSPPPHRVPVLQHHLRAEQRSRRVGEHPRHPDVLQTGFPAPAAAKGHGKGRDGKKINNPRRHSQRRRQQSHAATHPRDTPATAAPYSRQPQRGGSPGVGRFGAAGQPCTPVLCSNDLEKGGAGEDGEEGECRLAMAIIRLGGPFRGAAIAAGPWGGRSAEGTGRRGQAEEGKSGKKMERGRNAGGEGAECQKRP